jgi:thiamine transporter ThiT
MSVESPSPLVPAVDRPTARARNGLGTAALVTGVASLVAALSFVLLPAGLIGSVVAICLGVAALTRGRAGGTANPGQATAGLVCGILALALGIVFTVRVGTFIADNTGIFTTFSNCIAKAGSRSEVADCIARFANSVR